ncbi:MAG: PHP-associated domain-containing protein [Candidatus Binataceae bacterium]
MLVDLHVHTKLSSDSNVAPEQYLELASRADQRLGAICFTEHRIFPNDPALDREYESLSERFGVRIFKGIEADTDFGHLLIFGLTKEVLRKYDPEARLHKSEALIELVHGEGGIAIPAHPFRDSGYGRRLDDLVSQVGGALSAIEVLNGQNSDHENELAETAALKLGLTAVGGSDAHFATPKWFLTCATELERDVRSVEAMCDEIRAGRARPYEFPVDGG